MIILSRMLGLERFNTFEKHSHQTKAGKIAAQFKKCVF